MGEDKQGLDGALEGLDARKRATLKRLIGTGAFIAPVVASFGMADLSIDGFAQASVSNVVTTTTTHPTKS